MGCLYSKRSGLEDRIAQKSRWLWLILIFAFLFFEGCKETTKQPEKKTYTLRVNLDEGIDGYPSAGTYSYQDVLAVNYGYQVQENYSDFKLTLDGVSVSETGSVTMNANHTLAGTCFKRVLWKYYVDQSVYYSCPAIGDDGTIYFGTGIYLGPPYNEWRPGTMYAIGPDGIVKWSYFIGNSLFSPVIGNDGTIYIQDRLNKIYAFTPTGTLNWIYNDFDQNIYQRDMGERNPAVGADGTLYISADGLYAVNPQTGKRIWHFAHPTAPARECIASPVIGQDGTVYDTIGEDALFAVNPNGSLRWKFNFAHDWEMSFASPAIDQNGVIYLGVEGYWDNANYSNVYAINPDGTQRWKYPVDGNRPVRASAAIGPDGRIYIATKANGASLPAKLLALSSSGQKVWEYTVDSIHQTPDDSYSSPSVGADGLIYFGAETGFVYALNPDGSLNWKHSLRYGINWSSPAIANDGTLYIGSLDGDNYQGYLYALKSTSQGYASTPWPRFHHDRKNTGRFGAR
jgi:outer membrane protein assembly factor BamB